MKKILGGAKSEIQRYGGENARKILGLATQHYCARRQGHEGHTPLPSPGLDLVSAQETLQPSRPAGRRKNKKAMANHYTSQDKRLAALVAGAAAAAASAAALLLHRRRRLRREAAEGLEGRDGTEQHANGARHASSNRGDDFNNAGLPPRHAHTKSGSSGSLSDTYPAVDIGAVLGVDIGGTLSKLVYFEKKAPSKADYKRTPSEDPMGKKVGAYLVSDAASCQYRPIWHCMSFKTVPGCVFCMPPMRCTAVVTCTHVLLGLYVSVMYPQDSRTLNGNLFSNIFGTHF